MIVLTLAGNRRAASTNSRAHHSLSERTGLHLTHKSFHLICQLLPTVAAKGVCDGLPSAHHHRPGLAKLGRRLDIHAACGKLLQDLPRPLGDVVRTPPLRRPIDGVQLRRSALPPNTPLRGIRLDSLRAKMAGEFVTPESALPSLCAIGEANGLIDHLSTPESGYGNSLVPYSGSSSSVGRLYITCVEIGHGRLDCLVGMTHAQSRVVWRLLSLEIPLLLPKAIARRLGLDGASVRPNLSAQCLL